MSARVEFDDHFRTVLARDLAHMTLGDELGYGTSRAIFSHATRDDLIVKLETDSGSFSNVREADVWDAVKDTELAKWFAPVVEISPAGLVLLMKKCRVAIPEALPDKVPAFFTDLKAENWGIYEGRPVCLDYGLHLMLELGMTKRMRKARWT